MQKTVNLDIVGDYSRFGRDEFDPKRTLNMYVVYDPVGKNTKCLFTRPGIHEAKQIKLRGTNRAETIYGRAAHVFDNRTFVAIGDTFYFLDSTFNLVFLGSLNTDKGYVGIADNGTELIVVDGKGGWTYNKDTQVFQQITDPGFFENPSDVQVLAQRFIVIENGTKRWAISGINDALSWDTLDRAAITAYADITNAIRSIKGLLYLFGERSVEVWSDTGGSFPFSRLNTQTLDFGSAASGAAASDFEHLIWLSRTKSGQISIHMTDGGAPQRISNSALEQELSIYENHSDASAYMFKNDVGYIFYVINFTTDNRSWMYCINTNTWSQIAYKDTDRWLPEAYFNFNNKHYALSYNSFQVFEMSDIFYDDDGVSIKKMREVGVFSLPNYKNHSIHEVSFDLKVGVGKEYGKDEEPLLMLEVSRDGGIYFRNQLSKTIGKIGERRTQVNFFNLGQSHLTVFRIENYNNIPFVLLGCWMVIGVEE